MKTVVAILLTCVAAFGCTGSADDERGSSGASSTCKPACGKNEKCLDGQCWAHAVDGGDTTNCAAPLLKCTVNGASTCVDPSSPFHCGSCTNVCPASKPLCDSVECFAQSSDTDGGGNHPKDAGTSQPPDAGHEDEPDAGWDGTCPTGYADCDLNPANGCEVDLSVGTPWTDGNGNRHTYYCGSCQTICEAQNATTYCSAGKCHPKCDGTVYLNCDGDDNNGCETSVYDNGSCGGCGIVCKSNEVCSLLLEQCVQK